MKSFHISYSRNKNQFYKNLFEVILSSEFMNPDRRITSTFRPFARLAGSQAARISFRKTSNVIGQLDSSILISLFCLKFESCYQNI